MLFVAPSLDKHIMVPSTSPSHFEDGSPNFQAMAAVENGVRFMHHIGVENIHTRVMCLTDWLLSQLLSLHHSGQPDRKLVKVYGSQTAQNRGGTVTFNLFDEKGSWIPHKLVEQKACAQNIALRSGCFCNPGAGEAALMTPEDVKLRWALIEQMYDRVPKFLEHVDTKTDNPIFGMVRVSLGMASNFSDVFRVVQFVRQFLNAERTHAWVDDFWSKNGYPSSIC